MTERAAATTWLPGLRELLLAIFFLSCLSPVVDYDVWLHLASGRAMCESGQMLRTDIFSHTVPGKGWVYHEWLAAVLTYLVWKAAGLNGLILAKAAMMTASMALLLAAFEQRGHGRGAAPVLALLAAMVASRNVALERPHLFTILFLTAFVYWLERQRARGTPLPWGMAAVAVVWANVHGGFILGLLAFGPFLVEDLWQLARLWCESEGEGDPAGGEARTGDAGPRAAARVKRSLAVLAACAGATLLNPYGVETLLYPLQYARPSAALGQIDEWASPNFQRQLVLEAVLLLLAAALMRSRRRVGLADGIFALASAHLILTGARNSFLVGPFLGPAAVEHLASALEQGELPKRFARKVLELDRGVFGPLLLATVLAGGLWVVGQPPRLAPRRFPVEAVEWLRKERPPGRLFNEYDMGGYLMFNLPEYPVFVDGRVDVYSAHGAFDEFLSVWRLSPRWAEVLERRGVGVVLLERRQSLAALLSVAKGWRLAHRDDVAAVFVRLP